MILAVVGTILPPARRSPCRFRLSERRCPANHARPFTQSLDGPGSPSNSLKIFPSHPVTFLPTPRPRKSFSGNTYGPPRKCCKQKTYGRANSFRCNTYKKQGGGGPEGNCTPGISQNRCSFFSCSYKLPSFSSRRTASLFSCAYKLPISQALCFDIHASDGGCRGWWRTI